MSIPQQYDDQHFNHQNHNKSSKIATPHVLSGKKLEETFKAATDTIQNLPKNGSFQPSNELLLKFYGYFKQSTCGPCNKSRPGMFKVVERAKWDAWNSARTLSKEEAMNAYIEEIKNIVETMPHNETVQKFLDILGPFYEYVDDNEVTTTPANETINNNDRNLSDLNGHREDALLLVNNKQNGYNDATTSSSDDSLHLVNNDSAHDTPHVNGNNGLHDASDDEEDFCDTNDNIDTLQTIKILKSKINNPVTGANQNYNNYTNGNGGAGGYTNGGLNGGHSNDDFDGENDLVYNNGYDAQPFIINQFGGESNTSQSSQQMQSHRPSRPNSTHSNSFQRTPSNFGGGGGGGGAGSGGAGGTGGYQPPNDPFGNVNYLNTDSNRHIMLILMRLQQDTNNVLTRLSYLEATVMSIQNNLQMNRIENTIQATRNGYSHLTTNGAASTSSSSTSLWSYLTNVNIDWKTVFVAIIGPLVIRLVFLLLKKLKLFIKIKRSRRLL